MVRVEAFCDGACIPNPGMGAAAAVLIAYDDGLKIKEKEITSAVVEQTTNQRMELMGAILILSALNQPSNITITSDSQYLIKTMEERIGKWQLNGLKSYANSDLWEEIIRLAQGHEIIWQWVKGHSGHKQNERCNTLANAAIRRHQTKLLQGCPI